MRLYPGGTWWDRAARGHRFWQNFLCDLEWSVALDGEPNPVGSRFALAAMLVLIGGLAVFWTAVPRLFAGTRRAHRERRAVPILGLTSSAAIVAVALMPSERFGALHGALVVVAGLPALAAAILAVIALAIGEPRPRIAAWLGGVTLAVAAVDFALYVSHLVAGVEGTPLVPAAQKIALGFLLAWMNAVALRTSRPQDPHETAFGAARLDRSEPCTQYFVR